MTLKESLQLAILNLETNSTKYSWNIFSIDNCGVLAKCALSDRNINFKYIVERPFIYLEQYNLNKSWGVAVRECCDVRGESRFDIFKELKKIGIKHTDLVQLEYLSNPKILELSDIPKNNVLKKVEIGQENKDVEEIYYDYIKRFLLVDDVVKIPSSTFFGKIFGLKVNHIVKVVREVDEKIEKTKIVNKPVKIYKDEVVGYKYDDDYFKNKKNLILYLKGWIKLIEKEEKEKNEIAKNEKGRDTISS